MLFTATNLIKTGNPCPCNFLMRELARLLSEERVSSSVPVCAARAAASRACHNSSTDAASRHEACQQPTESLGPDVAWHEAAPLPTAARDSCICGAKPTNIRANPQSTNETMPRRRGHNDIISSFWPARAAFFWSLCCASQSA